MISFARPGEVDAHNRAYNGHKRKKALKYQGYGGQQSNSRENRAWQGRLLESFTWQPCLQPLFKLHLPQHDLTVLPIPAAELDEYLNMNASHVAGSKSPAGPPATFTKRRGLSWLFTVSKHVNKPSLGAPTALFFPGTSHSWLGTSPSQAYRAQRALHVSFRTLLLSTSVPLPFSCGPHLRVHALPPWAACKPFQRLSKTKQTTVSLRLDSLALFFSHSSNESQLLAISAVVTATARTPRSLSS